MSLAGVSKHIKVLERANLVERVLIEELTKELMETGKISYKG